MNELDTVNKSVIAVHASIVQTNQKLDGVIKAQQEIKDSVTALDKSVQEGFAAVNSQLDDISSKQKGMPLFEKLLVGVSPLPPALTVAGIQQTEKLIDSATNAVESFGDSVADTFGW